MNSTRAFVANALLYVTANAILTGLVLVMIGRHG
jgi:hypothetical protein